VLAEFKHGQAFQHMERGQHLERLGRLDEAMTEFKRAIEADPSIAAAHNALGHHYHRKGLLTRAVDEFHTASLLSRDYPSCFHLGRALSDLKRYTEAEEAFRQCLAIDAGAPSARYELACAQYAQGQFAEALAQFQSLAEEFPDDWELTSAMADCYMASKDYEQAERTLREALHSAPATMDTLSVHEALLAARRHLEFPPHRALGFKDLMYASHGVMCLGSGRDDGLDIPVYQNHSLTYSDVAMTCSRLMMVIREYGWQFSALVSVDADSMPLAVALSQLLDLPVLRVEELGEGDFALVVLAMGTQPELCEVTLEHVPGRMLSFALALTWQPHEGLVTDIVGFQCSGKCILPWKRLRKRSAVAAATSILRALATVPDEDNRQQQTTYYTRRHKLLRFFDLSAEFAERGGRDRLQVPPSGGEPPKQ
jgi:tetratricopeptide (TPR) repeat protein